MTKIKAIKIIFTVPIMLALMGCMGLLEIEPFGLYHRKIIGDFSLYQFEEGKEGYYLEVRKSYWEWSGVLNGNVGKIGWNKQYILAWQNPDNGKSGWFIIDAQTKIIQGPIAEIDMKIDPRILDIHIVSADEAWKKLSWSFF